MEAEYRKRINKVIDTIRKNPQEEYQLKDLAHIACFSPFHFHRVFTSFMSETPADFIRRQRIERSLKYLLQNKKTSITDIALDSGFSSSANFSKAFKIVTGCSPRQCRNMGYETAIRNIGCRRKVLADIEFRKWQNVLDSAYFVKRGEIPFLYLRYHGRYGFKLGVHWMKFIAILREKGYLSDSAEIFGIGYDNPDLTPSDKTIYDACMTVNDSVEDKELSFNTIPAADYAVFPFRGSSGKIDHLFSVIFGIWFPRNGLEPADGPVLQIIKKQPRGSVLDLDFYVPVFR